MGAVLFCLPAVRAALLPHGARRLRAGRDGGDARRLFGLFGVSRFAIDANPLMVGGLTLGLALVFLVAAYASARKVRRVDVRELVAE